MNGLYEWIEYAKSYLSGVVLHHSLLVNPASNSLELQNPESKKCNCQSNSLSFVRPVVYSS